MIAKVLVIFVLGGSAFARAATTADVIQVTGVSISGGAAQITLKNISPRIITAYWYTVTGRFAGGEERSTHQGIDEWAVVIGRAVGEKLEGVTPHDDLFRPGTTKVVSANLPGGVLLSATAEITMVALDDGTAVGDSGEIGNAESSRRRLLGTVSKVLGDLREVGSAPDARRKAAELVAAFDKETDSSGDFRTRANMMRGVPRMVEQQADGVERAIRAYEGLVAGMSASVTLREAP